MRLSDERIKYIADEIADTLTKKNMIEFKGIRSRFVTQIARTIIMDLKIEDEIDEEVIRIIKSMKREIPEGSPEWNSIFQQQKELQCKKLNYII